MTRSRQAEAIDRIGALSMRVTRAVHGIAKDGDFLPGELVCAMATALASIVVTEAEDGKLWALVDKTEEMFRAAAEGMIEERGR